MPPRLSSTATRRLRLRAQGLIRRGDNSSANPAAVVRALCAVQAQEAPSAALALRARASGLTAARVETARLDERSFLRTWVLRGTLHLVAPEDLGWLLALLAPASSEIASGATASSA